MEITPEDLRKLQLLELKILVEIKRVCDKHNINFILMGGTLLGAVRHKGFIPWDDDIDIGMTRDNYVKFCEIAPLEFSKEYFLQTTSTDNQYGKFFGAKVRLNGTKVFNIHEPKNFKNNGAFVDVFIFDNCPNSVLAGYYHWLVLHILSRVYYLRMGYHPRPASIIARIIMYFGVILCCPINTNKLKSILANYHEKFTRLSSNYVVPFANPYSFKKVRQLRSTMTEIIQVPFEGILMPVPKDYHLYLSIQYGNYMIPHPPKSRNRQHAVEIDFGIYK